MTKPVGIICATQSEVAPFLERLQDAQAEKKALFQFTRGTLDGVPVVVTCCGICKTNAAMVAQIMIDFFDVRAIVNAGTGGGMDPAVELFDVVVVTEFEHHDVDAFMMLVDSYPFYPSGVFQADEGLVQAAKRAAESFQGAVRYGKAVSGEQFISDEQRDAIVARCASLSVDMEGSSMAQVCYANGMPFIGVRAITDTAAHDGFGNYEANRDRASADASQFTSLLVAQL